VSLNEKRRPARLPAKPESPNAIANYRTNQLRQDQRDRGAAEHDRIADQFLQGIPAGGCPKKRRQKHAGLEAVFREVFPIESYDGKCMLDYDSYEIGEPKVDWLECLREGLTYGAPLYVTFLLKEEGKSAKEEKVFMGELPLMTPQGTFVINGAERVVVSQLHRSPGIAFEATQHPNGKMLHSFRVIPDRGSWYEAQFDTSDLLYVYLDRKKRRRKFLTTTFFRALSFLDVEGAPARARTRMR
jgi:DNA-directed RNA polymerase beta subunit